MLDLQIQSMLLTDTGGFSITAFLLCTAVSLVLGICIAAISIFRSTSSKGFAITLALLPAMVQMVIMLVNGNLGAGVAVMGAFSLVRFRSVPGKAEEISAIFLAMAVGLATGMGYIGTAVLFTVIIEAAAMILSAVHFGEKNKDTRILKITIPENLDYETIFEEVFHHYMNKWELVQVKTTNMGSLYKLDYEVSLKDLKETQKMMNDLRCRNGNLEILLGRVAKGKEEL